MGTYISVSLPVLFLAAVVQSSFVPQVRVFGGGPDLVLILVFCWSFHRDLDEGLVWAFVGGILQDLLSAAPTGAHTLGMIPTLFAVFWLNRQFFRIGVPLALMLLLGGTVVKEIILALVMVAAGFSGELTLFSYVILPTALYNVGVGFFAFAVIQRIQRHLERTPQVYR